MKILRLVLLGLFLSCFFFVGCGNQDSSETGGFYAEKFDVAGVGPEISFEPTVEDGTLVLRKTFEDMSVHVFLSKGMWEKYLKNESDYIPGNKVNLKGVVEGLDGAAGNHYYNVKSIEKLEVVDYPTNEEIKDLLDSYNYCETDDDCTYAMGECPFGCYVAFNKKFGEIPTKIMDNYFEINGKSCVYSCLYINAVKCENYKCVVELSGE